MSFRRSWVDQDSKKDTAPRSVTRRSGRSGGKGLSRTKVGQGPGEATGRERTMIQFDHIVPDPETVPCPRVNLGDGQRLARAIMDAGLRQPLLAWLHSGEYYLVDGWRRYQALEHVKATHRQYFRKFHGEVEVEVIEGTLAGVLIEQARVNLKSRTWNDADFACSCATLIETGLTSVEIAEKTGEAVGRVLEALAFKKNAVEELLDAVADGYAYEDARELSGKPEELQMFAVACFRQGKPKKKEPRPPAKGTDLPGVVKLTPKRRNVRQIGEALDKIEKAIEDAVNDEMVAFHAMEAASTRTVGENPYLRDRAKRIDELRGMRHALLFALGRRPDLLEIEDPVKIYDRGRKGGWFTMPSWRKE